MLQHDVITTFCLIVLIGKLVLRVNSNKQHDETTRQNNVVLFDYSSSAIIRSKQHNPNPHSKQPSISHHYRCKITTESRKVLYIKFPQHYFFKAADPISKYIQLVEILCVISSARLISRRPAALLLLTGLECFKRCLTFG
jgi:hypothetical protein